jgi:hypothetical protein
VDINKYNPQKAFNLHPIKNKSNSSTKKSGSAIITEHYSIYFKGKKENTIAIVPM